MGKQKLGATLIAAALSMSASHAAGAVVLEQKFQAGQSATYDATLDGTVSLNASDQTPVPWAGMPLSVPVAGDGQVVFDTLTTNSDNGATVALRIPTAKMTASVFGMNALVTAKNGVGTFSLNGAPGKTFPLSFLMNPTYALNVSRLGRIQGVTAISSGAGAKTAISSTGNAPQIVKIADAKTTGGGAAMLQKWLDLMPNFWPTRDLKAGDTWTVSSKIPLANAPGGVLDLGAINFKLIGEETAGGGALQHIAMSGTLTIDAAKAALLNAAKPKGDTAKGTMKIVSDSKAVNGDLWFDANAGRLARASLNIVATSALSGTTKPDAQGKTRAWNSTQGFNGTFGMQLNSVSITPLQTGAKTPQKTS